MAGKNHQMLPIVSKIYCSSTQVVLVVRRRPHAVNGGGFVVTDCNQKVVFRVDGCGILGKKEELILRDGDGQALLLIRRKGGLVEALSLYRKWKGSTFDYEGSQKLVFILKEPNSCMARNNVIRISVNGNSNKESNYEIKGYFPDRDCSIVDSKGNIVAQIGVKKEVENMVVETKDLYNVMVQQGMDQAFVFGVIAILDYIFGESTRC